MCRFWLSTACASMCAAESRTMSGTHRRNHRLCASTAHRRAYRASRLPCFTTPAPSPCCDGSVGDGDRDGAANGGVRLATLAGSATTTTWDRRWSRRMHNTGALSTAGGCTCAYTAPLALQPRHTLQRRALATTATVHGGAMSYDTHLACGR